MHMKVDVRFIEHHLLIVQVSFECKYSVRMEENMALTYNNEMVVTLVAELVNT